MKPYFTADKLDDLEKEVKTVPVNGEGNVLAVEYDEHFVRGTVLKLIADNRVQQEWIATVIRHYGHVIAHDLCKAGAELVADQNKS